MTYSCSDFTDDILNQLGDLGLLKSEDVPDDDPSEQADLAMAAIILLAKQRDELIQALMECKRWHKWLRWEYVQSRTASVIDTNKWKTHMALINSALKKAKTKS